MFKITIVFGSDADCRMAMFYGVAAVNADDAKSWGLITAKHLGLKVETIEVERTGK